MTKQQLEQLYSEGTAPGLAQIFEPGTFSSEWWRVNMLTGPIPDMGGWPLRHRKRFRNHWIPVGFNVMGRGMCWGTFTIRYSSHALLLDYKNEESNGRLTSRIVDFVRTTPDPDVLIGKFFFLLRGKLRGGWFFKLTRCK